MLGCVVCWGDLLSGCFCSFAEGGGRVSARRPRYLFFASPKKSTQKKGDPAARVPLARGARGQPAMLGPGVHRGTRCVPPAGELRSNNRGESVHDARVLRHALTPGPALLGTVRRGWERAPHGPLLRSARCAIAALGTQGGCAARRQRAARNRHPAPLRSSSRVVPAPHPCWLRREAQGLGWVRVPQDTRTSSSSLPMLFERSSPAGGTQRVHRHHPRSEHRRLPPFARQGERGTQTGGRLLFGDFLLATQEKVTAPPGAHPGLRPQHKQAATTTQEASTCPLNSPSESTGRTRMQEA